MSVSSRAYVNVSAAVFTLVAVLQAWRAASGAPLVIADMAIPAAASWIAAVFAGALAAWGWRTR